ncbi:secA regulator SecM [Candidatus Sodalis endolongispinus]|uniref:Secretion monitor n=1 Tax=Candidatus Sodalis endolongispinus TaxID=2812662 RepID=A0ABS5YCW6_9GAMM|nr:secA translation cis-regulator SecM [Candidatus Sodalis endolongispinus]MBT9432390.1 secA regulator SecM [Candidatus Sodalis endolongispinus]
MGILNRWRQIGRRYFWPHLLLGMVAAVFGVPLLPGVGQEMLHQADNCPSLSRQSAFQAGFSQLARLKDVPRRPTYAVDYWHQHAIRTVIRHLSIAWAPEAVAPLRVQHQVLLTTLGLLLNREARPPVLVRRLRLTDHVAFIDNRSGILLAQLQGIRAGPPAIA